MSCQAVASILDQHRSARLAPAERAEVDAHLAECNDCASAWHAATELLALRVPPMPATLLERVLRATRPPQSPPARRARVSIAVAGALVAGAALAGAGFVAVTRWPSLPLAPPVDNEAPAARPGATLEELLTPVNGTAPLERTDQTSVELVETALSLAPIVRNPPAYPPGALAQGIEGHVQLEFDVTAAGVVENVSVVESSDSRFEEPAVRAVREWRYLPRIAAGKRASSEGVHTIIRFALNRDTPPPPSPRDEQAQAAAAREWREFSAGIEVALDRLTRDDLRGAELQLDELQAVFGRERVDLWNFYGYLFTVQGNYDRAIDAYERGRALAAQSRPLPPGSWVALANLYFARHQYDLALKTLLGSDLAAERISLLDGSRRLSAEAEALLARLRALGVTEETVQ